MLQLGVADHLIEAIPSLGPSSDQSEVAVLKHFAFLCGITKWEINWLSAGEWSFTITAARRSFISTLQSTAVIISVYCKQHSNLSISGCYGHENAAIQYRFNMFNFKIHKGLSQT